MALTAMEQHRVVRHLGWPGKTLLPASTHYNTTVVSYLSNLSTEIETEVREILEKLERVEEMRLEALSRASTRRIGDIELNDNELGTLQKERRRLQMNLSDLLDIPVVASGGNQVHVRC